MYESRATATDHEVRDRELFDQSAETHVRKDLLPVSRLARKHRLLQTLRVAPLSSDISVLEVGCGAGFAARYLERRIGSYCGVDYSEHLISYARANNAGSKVDFVTANIKDFHPGRTFDLIFAIGVLHHLDDIKLTLGHMFTLLNPGGWLIANEPHPGNPLVSLARKIRNRVDTNYSAEQKELSAEELRSAYEAAGLQSARIVPQGLFSTPFAEVVIKPQCLFLPFSALTCFMDRMVARLPSVMIQRLTWNLIIAGKRPETQV
jgi:SAM-dependent methyltransferase